MYGNTFTQMGWQVTISYPAACEQHLYVTFHCANARKYFWLQVRFHVKAALFWLQHRFLKRRTSRWQWIGLAHHKVRPEISLNPYGILPSTFNQPDADILLVFQGQLLPQLLALPGTKGQIIDSLHIDNFENDATMSRWFNYLTESIWRRADVKRFAVSASSRKFFLSKQVRVDDVVHNGIDLNEFKVTPFDAKEESILMFCDPRPQKGYTFGVEILKAIKKQRPQLKFYSLGHVQSLNTDIFDHVYGFVAGHKMAEIYGRHRYFLFPSMYEGFPAPPLEAMATGAVCFLSRVAGIDEYGQHGVNALIMEPGDLSAFVDSIMHTLAHPEIGQKISATAVKTPPAYSWERSAQKIIRLAEQNRN